MPEMSFWDHLEELRWSLLRMGAAVLILMVGSFIAMPFIFDSFILGPSTEDFFMYRLLGGLFPGKFSVEILNINVTGPFFVHMSTSFWLALVVAFPYLLWELWKFISPALYKKERKNVGGAFLGAALLFYAGCAVGYALVFPITFRFLAGYQLGSLIDTQISLNSYISTFLSVIFMMGIMFELPVLIRLLGALGVVDRAFLKQYRPHAIVILMVLAAIITPTGDPFTLMVVFLPVYLLYELSVLSIH